MKDMHSRPYCSNWRGLWTVSDDLHAIIADQAETIDHLNDRIAALEEDVKYLDSEGRNEDPYWSGVYDRIRSAWDAWAFAELGTASPTPLDLEGRPELAALWESVR